MYGNCVLYCALRSVLGIFLFPNMAILFEHYAVVVYLKVIKKWLMLFQLSRIYLQLIELFVQLTCFVQCRTRNLLCSHRSECLTQVFSSLWSSVLRITHIDDLPTCTAPWARVCTQVASPHTAWMQLRTPSFCVFAFNQSWTSIVSNYFLP